MTTKLTLSLDTKVIEQAKRYSKKKGVSLSKMIESHLRSVVFRGKHPKKRSATGLIGIAGKTQKNINYDEVLFQALTEKYLK
jgi:hypothetical protein